MEDGKAHCAPHASQESFQAMFTLYFRVTRTTSMILWGLAVVEFRRHVGLRMGSGLKGIYLNVFSCGVITLLLPRRYPLFSNQGVLSVGTRQPLLNFSMYNI